MSQMSPAWQRTPSRETPEDPQYTSSSDSDSGCPRGDSPGIASDFPPTQVPLPCSSPKEGTVPAAVSSQYRIRALLCQLPPQDSDARYCPSVDEEERAELQRFCTQRKLESLGQGVLHSATSVPPGSLCEHCGRRIPRGGLAVVVVVAKHGGTSSWHPSCFVCSTCQEPLLDLIYFCHAGKIYCGRHHAELFRPRCASCDQLIFTAELMEAEGWYWHTGHFCCSDCDAALGGQRYIMKGGLPYCCTCFQSAHADSCESCGDTIGLDCERVTHQGQHWHAWTSCFCCDRCQRPLLGGEFLSHCGLLFCSEACSTGSDSSSSDSSDSAFLSAPSPVCKRPFRGGGGAPRAQRLVNCVNSSGETQKKRAPGAKLKTARSNGSFRADGDRRTSPLRARAREPSEAPATEDHSEGAQDHSWPEGCSRIQGQDILRTAHSQEDGVSWDRDSEGGSQAPAAAHGSSEKTSGELASKQGLADGKALSSAAPTAPQNICHEDQSNPSMRTRGSPKLSRHLQKPGPAPEGSGPSSPVQPQRHIMQQQQSPGSTDWRKQRRSTSSSTASTGAWSCRTDPSLIHSVPNGIAAQEQILPGDHTTILPASSDQEDSWCNSCSSSSDSEQEGFFLGRPIPGFSAGGHPISEKASRLHLKEGPRNKNCTLS